MSDSPKYSVYRLQQEIEQRLRETRVQHAREEAARRAVEAERQRQDRWQRSQRQAQADVGRLQKQLAALETGGGARFVAAERLTRLRSRLTQLGQQAAQAGNEDAVRKVQTELCGLRSEVGQLQAEADAAERSAHLAEEAARAAGLRARHAAITPDHAAKFDPGGAREVAELLETLDKQLAGKALAQSRQTADRCQARLERHAADVAQRLAQWTEQHERATQVVGQVVDRLAGLRASPAVMAWQTAGVSALAHHLSDLQSLLAAEQFMEIQAQAPAMLTEADALVDRAEAQQLDEDRRQYVVQGLLQALEDNALIVQSGYPALHHPADPASPTIICAQRVGGGALAITVPQQPEEEVQYEVDGFPMRVETGSDGQPCSTCDEAQQQIERVHEVLRQAFGIEAGGLTWNGQDPDRIRKTADQLPGSAPQAYRTL